MAEVSRRGLLQLIGLEAGYVMLSKGFYSPYHHLKPKALLIGIDGLRADSLPAVKTPSIDYLLTRGAYSYEAQAGNHTSSGPGWSTVLTGVGEAKHGVTDNAFTGSHLDLYPSLFTHLAQEKPKLKTGSLVSWQPLDDNIIKDGWVKEYLPYGHEEDLPVAARAAALLSRSQVDFLFAYFMSVDMAGHAHGFDPAVPEYAKAITTVDNYVGKLMRAIAGRPSYSQENWLVMLTSDHGGLGKVHGGTSLEEKTIPLVMHGLSVKPGKITPAPSQADLVPTLLHHLGVPVKPAWNLDGRAVGLR